MARNEHDGRSLEERLASLDALSGDSNQQPPAEQENAPPENEPFDPNANPWLSAPPPPPPPTFQQPSEKYAPETPGPPQPPPYDGGPMPQPFDGGMLPPPYATPSGYSENDPSKAAPQPPYEANGNTAPPLEELPPYPSDPHNPNAAQPTPPVDPNTGQPYAQNTNAPGQPYPPMDPNTGHPYPQDPNTAAQPYPSLDPNTGQPYAQDPNAAAQPYPPVDPSTGQPYAQDPNAAGQPYPAVDPSTGQPYAQDPNAAGQPYPAVDPSTGQPYAQDPNAAAQPYPAVDPSTGQPYAQDPNAAAQPYPAVDPSTGQPYAQDPNAAGQPYPAVDPSTGQPYAQDPNAAAQPYPPVDPNTGQPYPQDPNAAGQPYPAVDPSTGQPYAQDPNAAAQPYPPVDPNTGQPYPQGPNAAGQPYAQGTNAAAQQYPAIDPNTGQPMAGYGYPGQPPQGHPAQYAQHEQPQNADSLSSENLLGERRIAPSSGWRRAVYKATAGNIHPGESQVDLRRKDLIARARTPVAGGHHRVAVMSLKGGVGKTTTTTGLGSMLGQLRGDTVIAVDANPDRGTLSDKVKLETAATVRDLLNNREKIHRYADVRAFTSQNSARLEVLASDRDPAVSEAFSAEDYAAVAVVLEQFYSICITDCGTGLLHSAMAGVLSLADQLVLVSSPSVDGARSASATLDWLEAHNHGHLVRNGVVVLSMVRNRTRSQVDLDKLQAHFESRCRAVVRIPYDDHLEEGAEVELEQLAPGTREAYLMLAAVVGDGFAYQRPQ
ncbi:MinD-like ATPase involved in chromosome partitioning or flagellar assembly [Actinomadura pelletieri DSM 43383]|uniref:MinD-like ATPase involved in chromosome partitioning or flagellar assembly n=1 Tax=Actinomadura pelletieri DSM 43383 TaxID=1120940 RepID=A0A495QZ31_9ACTN|nr:MinD-like ATPase involved in chromosome partitioning or flagellar assembly [Actinomadura pelletieri DSM 43383]